MKGDLFGWDYPPGVRESDIPGCRPEDEECEVTVTLTLGELAEIDEWGMEANCLDTVIEQIRTRPDHPPLRIVKNTLRKNWIRRLFGG
jgi:hypothetical protein